MGGKKWLAGLVLGMCGSSMAWGQSAPTWGQPVGPIQNQVVDTGAGTLLFGSPPWSERFLSLKRLVPSFGRPKNAPNRPGSKKPSKRKTAPFSHEPPHERR